MPAVFLLLRSLVSTVSTTEQRTRVIRLAALLQHCPYPLPPPPPLLQDTRGSSAVDILRSPFWVDCLDATAALPTGTQPQAELSQRLRDLCGPARGVLESLADSLLTGEITVAAFRELQAAGLTEAALLRAARAVGKGEVTSELFAQVFHHLQSRLSLRPSCPAPQASHLSLMPGSER